MKEGCKNEKYFASFVREVNKYAYVSTIKCGRYVYEWKGSLSEAGVE